MKYEANSGSLGLKNVQFDLYPLETKGKSELNFEINFEILENTVENILVLWKLSLNFKPLFIIHSSYEMYVHKDGDGPINSTELISQASYPVLAEFSTLVSTLTKAVGVVPLVMSASELLELKSK